MLVLLLCICPFSNKYVFWCRFVLEDVKFRVLLSRLSLGSNKPIHDSVLEDIEVEELGLKGEEEGEEMVPPA